MNSLNHWQNSVNAWGFVNSVIGELMLYAKCT
jgi:hypothetical protein